MHFGHEQADTHALASDMIAMAARVSDDDTVETQPSQVIGHPSRRVLLRGVAHKLSDVRPQVGIAESLWQKREQTQCLKQGHHAFIPKTQGTSPLPIDELWLIDLFKGLIAQLAVLADLFDVEESSVGVKADLPQGG